VARAARGPSPQVSGRPDVSRESSASHQTGRDGLAPSGGSRSPGVLNFHNLHLDRLFSFITAMSCRITTKKKRIWLTTFIDFIILYRASKGNQIAICSFDPPEFYHNYLLYFIG